MLINLVDQLVQLCKSPCFNCCSWSLLQSGIQLFVAIFIAVDLAKEHHELCHDQTCYHQSWKLLQSIVRSIFIAIGHPIIDRDHHHDQSCNRLLWSSSQSNIQWLIVVIIIIYWSIINCNLHYNQISNHQSRLSLQMNVWSFVWPSDQSIVIIIVIELDHSCDHCCTQTCLFVPMRCSSQLNWAKCAVFPSNGSPIVTWGSMLGWSLLCNAPFPTFWAQLGISRYDG